MASKPKLTQKKPQFFFRLRRKARQFFLRLRRNWTIFFACGEIAHFFFRLQRFRLQRNRLISFCLRRERTCTLFFEVRHWKSVVPQAPSVRSRKTGFTTKRCASATFRHLFYALVPRVQRTETTESSLAAWVPRAEMTKVLAGLQGPQGTKRKKGLSARGSSGHFLYSRIPPGENGPFRLEFFSTGIFWSFFLSSVESIL